MAIALTGAIFHSLTFGSINSANYGIYITGQAVYNAPTRAVEMVDVPGRNGQIALDQGRWENIEVTYPAGCFADSESDFRDAISAFRNAVVSQIGYQRLTDTYNPNEYRMGVYMNGLEVKPSMLRAGQFDIVFNCKPQRWLTSGETAVTIANSGDTITNPTQYASSPLLMVEGYGAIDFNGYELEIENAVLGIVELAPSESGMTTLYTGFQNNELSMLNNGDSITIQESTMTFYVRDKSSGWYVTSFDSFSVSGPLGCSASGSISGYNNIVSVRIPPVTFQKGTSEQYTDTITVTATSTQNSSPYATHSGQISVEIYVKLTASSTAHIFRINYGTVQSTLFDKSNENRGYAGKIIGDSTQSLLGHPTYVDCDLGECYKIESGEYISLNGKIALGSDLPELASGENEITFDNTITELKIIPRWWRL